MELKDLDGVHVLGWAFGVGSVAGLAWALLQRKRVTLRFVVGSLLGTGLVGAASAVALRAVLPNYPELWVVSSILLGLAGTHGIDYAIKIFQYLVTGFAKYWLESHTSRKDDSDECE